MTENIRNVKRIPLSRLRIGMFLEDVFNQDGVLLLSAQTRITEMDQISRLRKQNVHEVFINTDKGDDLAEMIEPIKKDVFESQKIEVNEVEYYKELEKAKEINAQALEVARQTMNAIRMGRTFSSQDIRTISVEIVGSIFRNPDALVSLSQIKGYDEYTFAHSVNVSVLVASLARELGYDDQRILEAAIGGLLHDIGKMRVPEAVLNKPGKYTDLEFKIMQKHPEHGLDIVETKPGIPEVAKLIIGQHHERFDGSGYPRKLKETEISEVGLIAAVADVYDALTSNRVYRAAWTPQKALAMIFQGSKTDYAQHIVEKFTRHLGIFPVGSFVKLKNGEMGVVTRVGKGNLLSPRVAVLFNQTGGRLEVPVEYDLAQKQSASDGDNYKIEMSLNPKAFRVDVGIYIKDKII